MDRHYFFWIATFTSSRSEPDDLAALERLMSAAARAAAPGSFVGYEVYRDVGAVSMETSEQPVRAWKYCLIAELDPDVDVSRLTAAAPAPFSGSDWPAGLHCLSSEIAVRPARAGTAVPRRSGRTAAGAESFTTAIEYIDIPPEHWDHYKAFMRDVFGPVGRWLLEHGYSQKIVVTERVHSFRHDPSLPSWNRVHTLHGDFDRQHGGFAERTAEAASVILGKPASMASAMAPISYRRKPKMSKNVLVRSVGWRGEGLQVSANADSKNTKL